MTPYSCRCAWAPAPDWLARWPVVSGSGGRRRRKEGWLRGRGGGAGGGCGGDPSWLSWPGMIMIMTMTTVTEAKTLPHSQMRNSVSLGRRISRQRGHKYSTGYPPSLSPHFPLHLVLVLVLETRGCGCGCTSAVTATATDL